MLILIVGGFLVSVFTGQVEQTSQSAFGSAKIRGGAGIGLIGIYSLWLGLMRVAEKSGLVNAFQKIAPVLRLIFREVPAGSPAMGAMSMNIITICLVWVMPHPVGNKGDEGTEKLNMKQNPL